jgi:hypothetical protein
MMMRLRQTTTGLIALAIAAAGMAALRAQARETFTATATVKTAAGATATAPVKIVITRWMAEDEAGRLREAFVTGGAPALRKALTGVPPTGSIQIGAGEPTPTRLAIERVTDKGRLLTLVTDAPILHLGAGLPGAKGKEGYDFGVLDLEVDASGAGGGILAPAARIHVRQGAFVVDDYGAESIRLTKVTKAK